MPNAAARRASIDCIVSTSALELGVDIGSLDVCLLNGYPGHRRGDLAAASGAQGGATGRRWACWSRPAIRSTNTSSAIRNSSRPPRPSSARIAPDQPLILLDHIRCAAFELPFLDGERFGTRAAGRDARLSRSAEAWCITKGERWDWIADSYPANSGEPALGGRRQLRGGGSYRRQQDDHCRGRLFQRGVDAVRGRDPHGPVHPCQVEKLDWEGRKAFVTRTHADYYTDAIDYTKLKILDCFEDSHQTGQADRKRSAGGAAATARCIVVRRVAGYKKIRYYTHENIGYGQVNLPDQEMHTTAVWWQVAPAVLDAAFHARWQALDGFLGAAYALHHVAALLTLSERHDLGRAVGDGEGTWFASVDQNGRGNPRSISGETVEINERQFVPTVFLYDNYPGGIGLSAPLFDLRHEIVSRTIELVQDCGCLSGCPACVGPILASDESRGYAPKQAALTVLNLISLSIT